MLWPEERPLCVLAEDDPDVQFALSSFLRAIGYDLVVVDDGAALLDALAATSNDRERDADVIITDVRMPNMNGVSVAQTLRADGWRQPIVVVSAYDDPAIVAHVKRLPRTAFFAKPLDPDQLERTLVELRAARWPGPSRIFPR